MICCAPSSSCSCCYCCHLNDDASLSSHSGSDFVFCLPLLLFFFFLVICILLLLLLLLSLSLSQTINVNLEHEVHPGAPSNLQRTQPRHLNGSAGRAPLRSWMSLACRSRLEVACGATHLEGVDLRVSGREGALAARPSGPRRDTGSFEHVPEGKR